MTRPDFQTFHPSEEELEELTLNPHTVLVNVPQGYPVSYDLTTRKLTLDAAKHVQEELDALEKHVKGLETLVARRLRYPRATGATALGVLTAEGSLVLFDVRVESKPALSYQYRSLTLSNLFAPQQGDKFSLAPRHSTPASKSFWVSMAQAGKIEGLLYAVNAQASLTDPAPSDYRVLAFSLPPAEDTPEPIALDTSDTATGSTTTPTTKTSRRKTSSGA